MIGAPFELSHVENNPLDLVEELAESRGWAISRVDGTTLDIDLPGQKAVIEAAIEWQEEFSSLLVACSLPMEIAPAQYDMAAQTLEKINQNLWLGHFDLSTQGKHPTFRHTLLLRMVPAGIAVDLVADVLDLAVAECNRFYHTFQFAQAGDATKLKEDLTAAVFETVGEA